ncbi:4-alpha-glucanotransferase [Parasediminibacterium sp. JCM 36343]|uniref:4-alpha-glucanotransferase n=1 Tax=Parasediminibacterium sp. JCM 36343 TaxID=3374279 RepID=UPI00397D98A0
MKKTIPAIAADKLQPAVAKEADSNKEIAAAATTQKPTKAKASTKKSSDSPTATKTGNKVGTFSIPTKKPVAKRSEKATLSKKAAAVVATNIKQVSFQLRFFTVFGQTLYILGNHPLLGNNQPEKAVVLSYIDHECWGVSLDVDATLDKNIAYKYLLKNADGSISYDWGSDKLFNPSTFSQQHTLLLDSWNYAGYFENAFYSEPFKNVLLKNNHTPITVKSPSKTTHIFKAKAPLLTAGQTLCISGSSKALGNWSLETLVLMSREEGSPYFEARGDLSKDTFPVEYKYGIYDVNTKQFIRFEDGSNRVQRVASETNLQTIVNDGFAVFPANTWKGAGLAIPVFSLRSQKSFGIGEFTDIPALVDWCTRTGLKLIQILPINDTTATHTWVDSYPYAAISAFALHPMYLNVTELAGTAAGKKVVVSYEQERLRLNELPEVDYEAVNAAKWAIIRQLYTQQKEKTFKSTEYKAYFELNKHWLVPYACFCYLRDTNGTADFSRWPSNQEYKEQEFAALLDETSEAFNEIALHYFTQYSLHVQLKAATDYAHKNGIILKGDIAIGIYRNGADAWQQPNLYNMNLQAGAPPDDFAVKGQNWGFPTYNWQQMREDGFAWWKQRFEQMSYYFDAFRIDHILGFFRIWSIPMHAVEGILGYFVPAIPVHINEFSEGGIGFDYDRYTKPFINDKVLWDVFGYDNEFVKQRFLHNHGNGNYSLKDNYSTQRGVEQQLSDWNADSFTDKIKHGLFDLISNVILFEVEGSHGQQFHFRFNISSTSSFRNLDEGTRNKLDGLYVNYFFRRQDNYWMHEAMQKLPALKSVTNMLVCGEDLGLVPGCVPEVMKQLGLLSLEIQRMPKDPRKVFFHPNDAPYLSVVTPSTHDMSTIRGWWEEDKGRIQQFFNYELGQWGTAPYYCSGWVNKAIVLQHLYSPAMWSVFQLQDILGIDESIRRQNPNDERINVPANPKNYWRYRMHISLEDLLQADGFNNQFSSMLQESGRK